MMGDRMVVLSGDDGLALPMIAVGARGVVSVTSNVLPAEVVRATRLALDGKPDEARREHFRLMGVHEAMFLESNPTPVKTALSMTGMMSAAVRPPHASVSDATRRAIEVALEAYARGGH
jgi:4-hydroxy-tetrahydrodipicolinate synthase